MINKILISSDLLRPRIINNKIEYFHKSRLDKYYYTLVYQLKEATNIPVEKFSFDNTDFDFFKFYSLCNIELKNEYSWLNIYDLDNIPQDAIDYYKKYIEKSLVIYHEAPNIIKRIHNILKIPYIDLNIHPIRFLDDNFWGILTNNKEIFDRIKKYQIDERSFYIYANLIKAQIKTDQNSNILPNSILLTGQTNIDKSLYFNGKALSIIDFEDEIKELGQKYSKIYYKAHPYNNELNEIRKFLKRFDFIIETSENFYKLCADDNISAVASITSSTLYEAKYFEKDCIFLGHPHINLDYNKNCNFTEQTTLSIYNDFMNPKFWADILQDIIDVKKDVQNLILPHRNNELRTAFGDFWGQTELDPCVNINRKQIRDVKNKLNEEITNKKNEVLNTMSVKIKNKMDKFYYKEKIEQKRIIHLGPIKITYKKKKIQPTNNTENKPSDNYIFGEEAIYKMLKDFSFNTVLDIGCGAGVHSEIFKKHKKKVTSLDYGKSPYLLDKNNNNEVIIADFMEYDFKNKKFDAVWCCHVLEHSLNPNLFLEKINSVLKDDGVLAITVPPLKDEIVGGHVSFWNPGLLLYNLIIAGFDCREVILKRYGYNISIILKKRYIDIKSKLIFDNGDISLIKKYLPKSIKYNLNYKDVSFNGNIKEINW